MSRTIMKASEAVVALADRMMGSHHAELAAEKVRVAVLMVMPPVNKDGDKIGPAVQQGGVEATAKIKVASAGERVLADVDAIMEIDGERWGTLSPKTQAALVDHELEHLIVQVDKKGLTRRHPDGVPVLATQPDDWHLTGFESIVKRHGRHALEAMAIGELYENRQMVFEFMAGGAGSAGETQKPQNAKTPKRPRSRGPVTISSKRFEELAAAAP